MMMGRSAGLLLAVGVASGFLSLAQASAAPLDDTQNCRPVRSISAAAEDCPGVRPGGPIHLQGGGLCTMNFVFAGSDGRRYIGTAGHCALEGQGTKVWQRGTGLPAYDGADRRIGETAYATVGNDDFALIRLDKGVPSSPEMCVHGGPTALNTERTNDLTRLDFYGNGSGVGTVPGLNEPLLPARSALAPDMSDAKTVHAVGVAIFGDSGSAVNSSDGRAVGTLVGMESEGIIILRLGPQIRRAEGHLGLDLSLLTTK